MAWKGWKERDMAWRDRGKGIWRGKVVVGERYDVGERDMT